MASSRPAALSVPEGAIGIPLLFLCLAEPPYLLPSRSPLPGGVCRCGVVRLTTPGNRRPGVFCASRRTNGKASPPPKSQSSKNRCRCSYGGCLQPQKGVASPCLTETPTTSSQPSRGNFGVRRGPGCWRGLKRFGMAGCPMKHLPSIQSSPGVLLWVNDCVPVDTESGSSAHALVL